MFLVPQVDHVFSKRHQVASVLLRFARSTIQVLVKNPCISRLGQNLMLQTIAKIDLYLILDYHFRGLSPTKKSKNSRFAIEEPLCVYSPCFFWFVCVFLLKHLRILYLIYFFSPRTWLLDSRCYPTQTAKRLGRKHQGQQSWQWLENVGPGPSDSGKSGK